MAQRNELTNTHLVLHGVSTVIVIVLVAIFEIGNVASPVTRGFFRDDETLLHPLVEPETVRSSLLVVLSLIVPIVSLLLYQLVYLKERDARYLFVYVCNLIFGWCVTILITDMIKFSVGRLRPDFIARCKPDYSLLPANATSGFITQNICTGSESVIKEGRLSFLSGHSSTSFFGNFYTMLELERTRSHVASSVYLALVRPLVQLGYLTIALFVALSRISDYRHHPEDVASGAALGILLAIYFVYWVLPFLGLEKSRSKVEHSIGQADAPSNMA
eukprot:TRINITY_DN679_c0_g2_i1.p1 TRINITY_DN679_c0_g2~~TRINITY_DN679_c0_g2_i1.p1  ORF type:complete len:274 (+),score=64.93 TRINITY_DN679_c0_g2_i1:67-888(+)